MNTLFSSVPSPVKAGFTVQPPGRRATRLSARQLLEVELGLFLLSELRPGAAPDALPGLLRQSDSAWTTRQQKLRNRGLALLAHLTHNARWQELLEMYLMAPVHLQAYDIDRDRSGFRFKTVGFSRNRRTVLRKVLA
ncbi:hypothetical protein ACFPMF_12720 [Larkinella bovis]|uniref:pPIWI-RE three-gene island domain-containing protein n=1 Tax=Larkinella bovis TaxID=683041 RepID=A0ABW0ICC0_9BACT